MSTIDPAYRIADDLSADGTFETIVWGVDKDYPFVTHGIFYGAAVCKNDSFRRKLMATGLTMKGKKIFVFSSLCR